MRITTFEEFKELAQRGTFVPVCKEIVADLLTPVSAFLKIAEHSDYAFLLESVEGGEQVGRYSFLGKDPFLILRVARRARRSSIAPARRSESEKPFIATLRELMAGFHSPFVPGLPRFTGGAVGYLGYDAAAWFEPVTLQPASEPRTKAASCCSTRCSRSTTCVTGSSSSPTRGSPAMRTSSRCISSRARRSSSSSASSIGRSRSRTCPDRRRSR